MRFGYKHCKSDDVKHRNMMGVEKKRSQSPARKDLDKDETVKKVKTYNQVRNEVMDAGNQEMENVSQVVSKLKKPMALKK